MSFIYVPPTASVGQSNLTAATALTAGQAVAVNSSGQAAAVSGVAQGPGNVTLVTNSGDTTTTTWGTASAYDTVNKRLVVFYQKPTTGDYYCKVGTLTSGTWTFGTEVLAIANTGGTTVKNISSAIYSVTTGKIIFVSYFNNTSCSLIAGTVSGTTITFGAINTYTTLTVLNTAQLVYDDLTGNSIFALNTSTGVYVNTLSLSGTTITVNTAVQLTGASNATSVTAGNGYVINTRTGSPAGVYIDALEISGTTFINQFTSIILGGSGQAVYGHFYTPASTKQFMIVTSYTSNIYLNNYTYSTAGGLTLYNQLLALASGTYSFVNSYPFALAYDTSTGYNVFTWTPASTSQTMQTTLYTLSGTTNTYLTSFNANSTTNRTAYNYLISLNNASLIYTYRDASNGYTYSLPEYETTTTNYTGFIGFASASYGIGASATILTDGAITTSQSGLTPGLKYYVQPDGTLTTTVGSNQFAGHALSATSLLILG